ncbi:MAG: chromate transporter [Oscillospiraceae bacterium]|nr:chromate transporter [Oscillospiraceae bacterium]
MTNTEKAHRCGTLFRTFFKIGAFTFGGGYAMIPLIQKETVESHSWISDADILDIVAMAEATPGPIAINCATFVGYKVAGFWGSLCATLGVVLPSFTIISILAFFLEPFKTLKVVSYAFVGIRAGVMVLIVQAILKMQKSCERNWINTLILLGAFVCVAFLDLSVILILLVSAACGILYQALCAKRITKREGEK